MSMNLNSKIYLAGHKGLAGSAIERVLRAQGFSNLELKTHKELDLEDARQVESFFSAQKPEVVILAAAKVGGIKANNSYPADFIFKNLKIELNVIEAAQRNGAARLLFLGSSCIYPKASPQPIREEYLLTGPLEPTNRPYALAKISGIEMCWSLNRQKGTHYLAAMPTNLYGPGDNYHLENSHVLPALIRKMVEAREQEKNSVLLWGSGNPKREFLHSDDLASACVHLLKLPEPDFADLTRSETSPPLINIGCGEDLSIRDLAMLVKDVVGFKGDLKFDPNQPDGTLRKVLDVTKLNRLGWQAKISLREGIVSAMEDFIQRRNSGQIEV